MSEMRDRLGRLPLERRARFLTMLRSGRDGDQADRPARRPSGAPAPLSHGQNLLWFLEQQTPGLTAYNLVYSFQLCGGLDTGALQAAFDDLVARHEPLRTRLPERDSGPVQLVAAPEPGSLPLVAVPGADLASRRERCQQRAEALTAGPFDLAAGPLWRAALYRIEAHEHLLVFVVHHIIFDGVSAEIFVRDLAELYRARLNGAAAVLPELTVQHPDFAVWERSRGSGARYERQLAFWRDKLRDAPLLDVPGDRPRPPRQSYRGAVAVSPLNAASVEKARQLGRDLGITTYPVHLAAFLVLLQRYTDHHDLVVGCSTAVRNRPELENVLGFLVNMLPLRVDLADQPSFATLAQRVDQVLKDALSHVDVPFEHVVKEVAPVRDPARSPLVQVSFTQGQPPRLPTFPGLEVSYQQIATHTTKSDMVWQVYEAGPESTVGAEYSTDLYDQPTIERMLGHYGELLRSLLADPSRCVSEAEMMTDAERAEVLGRWQGRKRPVRPVTIHGWFAEHARADPDRIALAAGERRLTYAELDDRANRIAGLLRRHGVAPEERVALVLPRGLDYPSAVLGTLQAGGAFVPLDPTHPTDRIAELLRDSSPRAVLTDAAHAPGVPVGDWVVLTVEHALAEPVERPTSLPTVTPDDLAYVLYTSGSTGRPKGVLIEHRNVVNFVESTQAMFALRPDDRILGYAAHTFDVSIFEMFGALLSGAQLRIALESDRLDLDRLQLLLESGGISVVDLPPSVMALLEPERLTALRVAFVGGEAFPGGLVNRWNKVCRFVNGYGLTEGTVTQIAQDCDGQWDASPPIGLPMDNHVGYVVDAQMRPAPYGTPGELVIGGEGLARGYLRRPEITREKFVSDPFGGSPDGRLYRTGDLVRRLHSGELMFLGRVDRQIKIRGVRIEPSEIESVLVQHPAIRQALVQAWTDPRGARRLIGHVAAPPATGVAPPTSEELRRHLATTLPTTLIPSHLVVLPELPLTSSGKVDHAALPAPDLTGPATTPDFSGPRTETERILAEELFGELFDQTDIPASANFFALGGSSLQAAQLISAIRRRFEVEVSVADFFLDSTVTGLAALVERQQALAPDDDPMLDLIDEISDGRTGPLMDQPRVAGGI